MPTATAIQNALKQISNQASFFPTLLNQTLGWPITDAQKIEDISYSWSADDLHAAELERDLIDGVVWQIQPLEQGQPWGIFVLEFKSAKLFTSGRGMASVLRKILRGLVSSRRNQAGLPSWKREHLLFICTQGWQQFRFAYFRSKPEDPRSSRLTTFGWEPGSSNRTVCEFNLPALVWPDDSTKADKWIADWAKAFDKDRLTNDFFKRFDQALGLIKSDLQDFQKLKSDEAYTQAQLLLERLIFLYFLQNRGWLKQDSRYLSNSLQEHLKEPGGFSYYGEFLEKVFWSLSTPQLSSGDRIHGLPFLNGGLFDDDEFDPSERRKKTSPPLKVRNGTLGSVFRDLLEAFNFTVTEDTPLNQEVAVDPEMLGKVFESIVLHAEQADPDATAPDKRKATGSYYTSRIVVHFICQEVLYQYLKNHLVGKDWGSRLRAILAIDASDGIDETEREALKKIISPSQSAEALNLITPLRCCDPAVGSGAFPVGLLHELVNLRRILQTVANGYVDPVRKEGSSWLQTTKQEIVQNCLFGVDIQQQAIEICRLRLWLSLVVDYDIGLDPFKADKTEFNRAIDGISQLPNLEMNFHRGDSLHDYISGVPIVIMPEKASHYADDFAKIAKLGEQLHQAKRAERKRKLRVQILERRLDLSLQILREELKSLDRDDSSLDKLFHDETESSSSKRKRISHERSQLQQALGRIETDRKELERLSQREFDNQLYVKLRKLEGADFNSPFNFAWFIDFPGIFSGQNGARGGFDVIVGNPPFVTARNPEKRELWRERWPRVCYQTYHLLCPFFDLSFGLLKANGQLGFIVSNAFAKRDFGKPLVEDLLADLDIQELVDCSGLLFPGHGTPTCLVFGLNRPPEKTSTVRNVAILAGGGDLRTAPEESQLWRDIEEHHAVAKVRGQNEPLDGADLNQGFRLVYEDARLAIGDCDRKRVFSHPCSWVFPEWPAFSHLNSQTGGHLSDFIEDEFGFCIKTNADDIFLLQADQCRRFRLPHELLRPYHQGEEIRNWQSPIPAFILLTYSTKGKILSEKELGTQAIAYLSRFKKGLEERRSFGNKTFKQLGWPWYAYDRMNANKYRSDCFLVFPHIATHNHCTFVDEWRGYGRHAQVAKLRTGDDRKQYLLLAGVLNSSSALFWLKQVCFNKGAGEDEERDRFEFAGMKLKDLPMPAGLGQTEAKNGQPWTRALAELTTKCWGHAQRTPSLSIRRLFEKDGEAYQEWNTSLPGYIPIPPELNNCFDNSTSLRESYNQIQRVREQLRAEMVAMQEEMDWTLYAAYRLLPEDHPASRVDLEPGMLDRDDRPFSIWAKAEGEFTSAVNMIPSDWPESRRKLWAARLTVIRESEHVRRIEQPVYKRRWDEQWKVGNQWRCGPVAYAAEFVDAFESWLKEKAEWWLEKKKNGGPVEFDEWAEALWKDARVCAAWPVAAEDYAKQKYDRELQNADENDEPTPAPITPAKDFVSFRSELKRILDEETVAEGIPFAVPYEELEKKLKRRIPGNVSKVRGKLNVPRERFHLRGKTQYLWAGRQFSE